MRGPHRSRTNDAFPPVLATRFPLEDAIVPAKGAGSHVLAISLPFGALRLPTSAFPWGGEETRSGAHAPVFPEGAGPRLQERAGVGEEKGIPTCGILGVPEVGSFPLKL